MKGELALPSGPPLADGFQAVHHRTSHPLHDGASLMQTIGARASAAWLEDLGLDTRRTPRWYVEVMLTAASAGEDVRFELNVYPEEWGYVLRAGTRVSSIRITDAPFIHGRDAHQLLSLTPALSRVGELIAVIETRRIVAFRRSQAIVRSDLVRATSVVRTWLNTI